MFQDWFGLLLMFIPFLQHTFFLTPCLIPQLSSPRGSEAWLAASEKTKVAMGSCAIKPTTEAHLGRWLARAGFFFRGQSKWPFFRKFGDNNFRNPIGSWRSNTPMPQKLKNDSNLMQFGWFPENKNRNKGHFWIRVMLQVTYKPRSKLWQLMPLDICLFVLHWSAQTGDRTQCQCQRKCCTSKMVSKTRQW